MEDVGRDRKIMTIALTTEKFNPRNILEYRFYTNKLILEEINNYELHRGNIN